MEEFRRLQSAAGSRRSYASSGRRATESFPPGHGFVVPSGVVPGDGEESTDWGLRTQLRSFSFEGPFCKVQGLVCRSYLLK